MLSIRNGRRKGGLGRGKHALVALCVLAGALGCGTQWLPNRLEVEAAAVHEVRNIGQVVTQTTEELEYSNTIQFTKILVVDVGKNTFSEALNSAHDRLRRLGWTDVDRGPNFIQMESAKWEKVVLTVGSLERLESFHAELKPEIAKAFKNNAAGPHSYLLVDLAKVK